MDLTRTCLLSIPLTMGLWGGASINLAGQAGLIEREGLDLPAECILGETCWVANYVDVDPADAALDFHCNPRTYNGHEGTDFAIRDLAIMVRGVPVVASAAGIVRSVRDGMVDVAITNEGNRWSGAPRSDWSACRGKRSFPMCISWCVTTGRWSIHLPGSGRPRAADASPDQYGGRTGRFPMRRSRSITLAFPMARPTLKPFEAAYRRRSP